MDATVKLDNASHTSDSEVNKVYKCYGRSRPVSIILRKMFTFSQWCVMEIALVCVWSQVNILGVEIAKYWYPTTIGTTQKIKEVKSS